MKTKHTPGPWAVDETETGDVYVVAGYYEDQPTLQVLVQDCSLQQPHKQANARLIASAPDLLSLIVDLRRDLVAAGIESEDCSSDGNVAETMDFYFAKIEQLIENAGGSK